MANGSASKRDFFISFNKADRAWATWIAWVLEEAGYSVFFQDWDFRGNFVEHMDRAHRQADRTIAVLSDHYFGSGFTLTEWSARFAEDPAAREDRLVPIKVGPLSNRGILNTIVYADLTGCDEAEAQQRLLERVNKAIDPRYRPKPLDRPGFPAAPAREVPSKPQFPASELADTLSVAAELTAPIKSPLPQASAAPRYLQDTLVTGGMGSEPPKFRARFGRSGREAAFYVRYSMYVGCAGITWTEPRQLAVYHQARFAVGEEVEFAIISPCEADGDTRWCFGLPPKADKAVGPPRDLLNAATWYRGRVTLLASDDTTEHCYFIAESGHDPSIMPKVIGQHMFDHIWTWENKVPPSGHAEALFCQSK